MSEPTYRRRRRRRDPPGEAPVAEAPAGDTPVADTPGVDTPVADPPNVGAPPTAPPAPTRPAALTPGRPAALTRPVHDPDEDEADRERREVREPAAGPEGGQDDREVERGLRGLVGGGSSQVSVAAALRARDATRPTGQDLATAESDLVIIRRGWTPPAG
jgi:hypothetical protein